MMTLEADLRSMIDREVAFPTSRDTVQDRMGDQPIPGVGEDGERIGDVLDRTDRAEYQTEEELLDVILANVGEEQIGRKHYDDRGQNLHNEQPESL